MKILLLESFYASSHKQWADGLITNSNHDIRLLSLPGRHWKWRMHHAGKHFAFEIAKSVHTKHDLILCSDLMNVAEFRGILSALGNSTSWYNNVPVVTYFHENQITYPWSEDDPDIKMKRDNHYGWINYTTCLSSDYLLFNSQFHKQSLISALPVFLDQFPKEGQENFVSDIANKSSVLSIGMDLKKLASAKPMKNETPVILWNHRWEYDKNPNGFFEALMTLDSEGYNFEVIVAGEKYKHAPEIFATAKKQLAEKIIHFGFASSREEYIKLLLKSDILLVTSNQDFFGISVVEAIAAGCSPLLPYRLAFPEHLDKTEHSAFYYHDDQEMLQRLKQQLQHRTELQPSVRNHVLKYDWSEMGPKYDAHFQQIINDKIT